MWATAIWVGWTGRTTTSSLTTILCSWYVLTNAGLSFWPSNRLTLFFDRLTHNTTQHKQVAGMVFCFTEALLAYRTFPLPKKQVGRVGA